MTAEKHKRVVGDTLLPLNRIIRLGPNRDPVDLSTFGAVKFEIEYRQRHEPVSSHGNRSNDSPDADLHGSATTDLLTCNGHGVNAGDVHRWRQLAHAADRISREHEIQVQVTPNTFSLSTNPGGAAIDITGAGTGTHTFYIVGSVQYDFSVTAAGTVGNFRGWFTGVTAARSRRSRMMSMGFR
jgi:hypothetical protein